MPTECAAEPSARGALVGGLHEAGAAAGQDLAAHLCQGGAESPDLVVDVCAGFGTRGAEDGDTEGVSLGRLDAGEVVHDFPQTEDGVHEDLLDGLLVGEAYSALAGRFRAVVGHACALLLACGQISMVS